MNDLLQQKQDQEDQDNGKDQDHEHSPEDDKWLEHDSDLSDEDEQQEDACLWKT